MMICHRMSEKRKTPSNYRGVARPTIKHKTTFFHSNPKIFLSFFNSWQRFWRWKFRSKCISEEVKKQPSDDDADEEDFRQKNSLLASFSSLKALLAVHYESCGRSKQSKESDKWYLHTIASILFPWSTDIFLASINHLNRNEEIPFFFAQCNEWKTIFYPCNC